MNKSILIEPGKPPQITGEWTVGELLQVAQALNTWVQGIPLTITQPSQAEDKVEIKENG